MDMEPDLKELRAAHGPSLDQARDKLFWFLCGYFGGPDHYIERFGHPRLRARHLPFSIGQIERDQWVTCIGRAMEDQGIAPPLADDTRGGALRQAWPAPLAGAMLSDASRLAGSGPEIFSPAHYGDRARPGDAGGRQAAWFVQGQGWQGVLRRYRRGGMIARVSRDAYLWNGEDRTRSFREYRLLAAMRAQGLAAFDAAAAGALLHALAGDSAAADGARGLLPTDLLAPLRRLANPDLSP
ncbi:hypothetical protein G6F35_014432 [Rhizopus arrhizus]|nr:hypothetical protein G6F35_014432 [Rhizopus arrhizus]